MINNRVLILGCGPAGLLAAHGAVMAGIPKGNVEIYSRKAKSYLNGAQYLHRDIPGLGLCPPEELSYELIGTHDEYRRKVYGDDFSAIGVSPESYSGTSKVWDIREAYDLLWKHFEKQIQDWEFIGPHISQHYEDMCERYRFIFSTVPRQVMCVDPTHQFQSAKVWAIGDAPGLGIQCPIWVNDNSVVCDGTREVGWYRAANIFGHKTAEWPGERKPPIPGISAVNKPVSTNCNCFPGIDYMGRYGRWSKQELAHNSFERAAYLISGQEF